MSIEMKQNARNVTSQILHDELLRNVVCLPSIMRTCLNTDSLHGQTDVQRERETLTLKRSTRTFFSRQAANSPPNGEIHFDLYLIVGFSSVSRKRIIPVGLFVSSRRGEDTAARERNEENTKRDGGREGWPEHPQGSIIREIGFGIFQIPSPTGKHRRRSVVSRVCLVGNVFSSLREVSALQSNYTVFAGRFSQKGEGEREREKGIEKPTPKSRSVDAYRRRVSGKLSAHPVSKYQDKRTFSRKFEGNNERKVRKSGEDKKPSRVIFRASLRLRHLETIPHFADSASRLTSTP